MRFRISSKGCFMALAVGCSTFLSPSSGIAEDKPAPPPPVSAAPVAPNAAGKIYAPTDLPNLRLVVNQKATVEGTLVRVGESKNKSVRYLNFTANYREGLALVFFANKGGDAFSMEKLQGWVGKKVRVTGLVTEYNSTLQIEVEKWDQVQEIKEPKS